MNKIIILIAIILSTSALSQNYWESSDCYSDRYQFGSNHPSYYMYGRFDVGLSEKFKENGRAYYNSLNFNMDLTFVRAFKFHDSNYGEGCPGDSDYHHSNTFPSSSTVTMNAKLYRDNGNGYFEVINEIVPTYTFLPSINVASQFQDQIDNWIVPELEYGGGYKIVFYLTHDHYPNYYNPFNATASAESGTFTIGDPAQIISPDLSEIVNDLSPTLVWEDMSNAEYKIVLGLASNPPNFSFNSNTGIYTISNAMYHSPYSTDTQLTLSEGLLSANTEYVISVITKFDGVEFRSEQTFTTREEGVIMNDLEFYSQVSSNSSNPDNYINTGVPVRFKTKVRNELPQNLSTLQATLTSSTSGVTITDNNSGFGNIGSNMSAWSSNEFEILVDESVSPGTLLEFTLSCNDYLVSGGPWESNFSFPIEPLDNGNIVLIDNSGGDGDGQPEPGESLQLFPTINNGSNQTIALVSGDLSCEQDFINVTEEYWRYNMLSNVQTPIEPGNENIVPEFGYEFDYSGSAPFQELNFNLELKGNLNDVDGPLMKWQTHFLFNEGIEGPPILISTVPADESSEVEIDANFQLLFDKAVNAVSGKYIYFYQSNGNLEMSLDATDNEVSVNTEIVTINLNDELLGGTDYYIIIDEGAFIDGTGNGFEGINTPDVWNFSTKQIDPPNAPTNLAASATSESQIYITWTGVETADNYKIMSCDESITYADNISTIEYWLGGLDPSTNYDFIVKAQNTAGFSDASECVEESTFCMHEWGDPVIYSNSTTAYGIVTIDDLPATNQDIVGVFVGNECRGIGNVIIDGGVAYVTLNIQGETSEVASFKVWNMSECEELEVDYTVTTNPGSVLGYPPNYLPIGASTAPPCYEQDFDCDCDVDIIDVTMAAYAYGSTVGDANYNVVFDLDNDGDIGIIDITMVAYNYGWSCDDNSKSTLQTNNTNVILSIDDQYSELEEVGYLNLLINGVEQLGAYELNLSFIPQEIEILELNGGKLLNKTNREILELASSINNGMIQYAITSLGSETNGANGSGELLSIKYRKKTPNGSIQFENGQIVRIDGEIIPFEIDQVLGLQNNIVSQARIYPIPMKDILHIEYQIKEVGDIEFELQDINGKIIFNWKENHSTTGLHQSELHRNGLESGTYLLKIKDDKYIWKQMKLIIH